MVEVGVYCFSAFDMHDHRNGAILKTGPAVGCTPAADATTDGETTTPEVATNEADAGAGEMTMAAHRDADGDLYCVVMNKKVASEEEAFGHSDYEGKRYYFCCAGCPDAFDSDPAMYAVVDTEDEIDEDTSVEEPTS